MAVPVWSVGQVLTADDVNQWLTPFTAVKPADTSRASTTTQSADPDLVLALAANASYYITGYITYFGNTQGNGDLKFSFTAPAGSTAQWVPLFVTTSGSLTNTLNPQSPGTSNNVTAGTSAAADRAVTVWANISTAGTAGNWTLFWAQGTSSGTATIVRANSLLVAQRIG